MWSQVFFMYSQLLFMLYLIPMSTLCLVTPFLALTFEIFLLVLHDPIVGRTPLGEKVRSD